MTVNFSIVLEKSNFPIWEGNVQFVHKDINFMKQSLSQEDFIYYCKKISKYNKGK